jgi:NAD(P)-dependent dehydrogenase (short-subunit alcohol dehydrogenase family)
MSSLTKVAIVTGASSDIGFSIVETLASADYLVIAQVHSNRNAIDTLSKRENIQIVQHSLSTPEQARAFINQVVGAHKRIDALINTIGPLLTKPLDELTPEEWQNQIHFNLNLSFYLSHFAKQFLIESKGQIVNFTFSGVEFLKARLDSTPYCAAKAGLVILTKTLASSLARHGVRVNAISPGLIEKDQPSQIERVELADGIPFGRPGTPSEVSELLLWLLMKSPSYMTGALLPISGAWEYI